MVSHGRKSISADELHSRITDEDILRKYIGVEYIPCLIHSPLRQDERPSFSLFYSRKGTDVLYKDHSNGDCGDVLRLLSLMWNCSRVDVITRIWNECDCATRDIVPVVKRQQEPTEIQIKVRKCEARDIEFWGKYGITKQWLRFAGIVPISHFILVTGGRCIIYQADEYAYAYTSDFGIKVYQPYSQMKWRSSQKKGYVQLYDKLPESGEAVCVCSSMKDALCLWANTGIPSIAPQSEGIPLPPEVTKSLKARFKKQYVLYDNDKAGLGYAIEAARDTGFTNIVLPQFECGKDISDWYKSLTDKNQFQTIKKMFNGT